MKHISTHKTLNWRTIFFFVFISFYAQTKEKAELTINISDCRDSNFTYLSELKVLKNGKEFKILEPKFESIQILKDLELGTYTLIYKSLFDKEESLKVEITENQKYWTTICTNFIDYSKETYKPIIDQLQENDFYIVVISSKGCFHETKDNFTIKRKKDNYTITWGAKTKKLNIIDIELLKHFEIELNYMTDGGCTTTDTYIVNYSGTIIKQIDDGNCSWKGVYYLKKQLFDDK